MSYDIRFAVKVAGAEDQFAVIGQPEKSSPTYNLRDMFVACMDWDYEQGEWYRLSEILPKIAHGAVELISHRSKYEKYNSPNGWGTVDNAISALQSIMGWVSDLKDSWNGDIPLECIYMAW